jgi:hypothetical protein
MLDGAYITPYMNRRAHAQVNMTASTEEAQHTFDLTPGSDYKLNSNLRASNLLSC